MDHNQAGAMPERGARVLKYLRRFEDAVLALLLSAMITLAALQIFLRNVFETGIGWADPTVRLLVLWVGLLGALAASHDDRQINVDVLTRLLPEQARAVVRIITHLATAAISALVAYEAGRFVLSEYEFGSVAFASVPTWVSAAIVPLAFAGIALRYLILAVQRGQALVSSESGRS
jgi:TRAP-type C4-dicarboxylate transport system permease small subunit